MHDRVGEKIRQYMCGDTQAMQLATVAGNQPWVCTVYFVADDELNLYWLSWPTRRHSKELMGNSKVAAAIAIKQDQPIIGVQIEGIAEEVEDAGVVESVVQKYVSKYGVGREFYKNFIIGANHHRMYRLTPSLFVLMDEVNFRKDGRIEWRPFRK